MKKWYTLLVVFFPILSVYSTPIAKLSIADFCMLIFLIFAIVSVKKIKFYPNTKILLFFAIYIIITFLFQILFNTEVGFLSTIRYVLYILFLMFSFDNFDFELGIKTLKYTSLIISVYVVIQYLSFAIFSYPLPWYLPFLKVMDENFITIASKSYYLQFYRPTGIFLEPTHYAQYILIYYFYVLFSDKYIKRKFLQLFILIAGLLCCGSSIAFIIIMLSVGFILISKSKNKNGSVKKILFVILVLLSVVLLFNIPYFKRIVTRMLGNDTSTSVLYGPAMGYRFDATLAYFKSDIGIFKFLFGTGRGSEIAYFTGIFYLLKNNGLIGLLIYLVLCFSIFIKSKGFVRYLIMAIFILSIGSEFVVNYGLIYYFCFILNRYNFPLLKKYSYGGN